MIKGEYYIMKPMFKIYFIFSFLISIIILYCILSWQGIVGFLYGIIYTIIAVIYVVLMRGNAKKDEEKNEY